MWLWYIDLVTKYTAWRLCTCWRRGNSHGSGRCRCPLLWWDRHEWWRFQVHSGSNDLSNQTETYSELLRNRQRHIQTHRDCRHAHTYVDTCRHMQTHAARRSKKVHIVVTGKKACCRSGTYEHHHRCRRRHCRCGNLNDHCYGRAHHHHHHNIITAALSAS